MNRLIYATRRGLMAGRRALLLATLGGLLASPGFAAPSGPLRIIVGFVPGGPADTWVRTIAEGVSQELGETVVIENKPGASGDIAAVMVARSSPDENMLFMSGAPQHGSGAVARGKLSFDPLKDFTMVAPIARTENVLAVRADSPFSTLRELVDAAQPGKEKLTAGTPGIGTSPHLVLELLKYQTGANIADVAYRGAGAAVIDLLGGHIDMLVVPYPAVAAQIEAGQIRPLAVLSEKRAEVLPNVPTAEEAGFPGVKILVWGGLVGPAGMDPARVLQLNDAVNTVLRTEDVSKRFKAGSATPFIATQQEFQKIVEEDLATWTKIAAEAKLDLSTAK